MLGVHVKIIRRWKKKGLLRENYRKAGGHKGYSYERITKILSEIVRRGRIEKIDFESTKEIKEEGMKRKRVVIYTRVSSSKQKEDLERQIELLKGMVQEKEE